MAKRIKYENSISISKCLEDIDFEMDCLNIVIKDWNKKSLDEKLLSLDTMIKDFNFYSPKLNESYKKIIAILKETHTLV